MNAEELGVGKLIATEQQRDAIHCAIAPIIAAEDMHAGDRIVIRDGKAIQARIGDVAMGVADPFLRETIHEGDKFWLFLNPGTITSLRHEWTHPAFVGGNAIGQMSESERWLRQFANQVDVDYDAMIDVAKTHCGSGWGEFLCEGGKWEGQGTPDEFWTHFTNVTGMNPNTKYGLPGIFSCSC